MGELVPEKRMDRNGRLVTRHVRQAARTGGGTPIPPQAPPATATEPLPYEVAGEIGMDIEDGLISADDIRAIGVELFQRRDFSWYLRGALRNLRSEEPPASTEQIAYAMKRATAEEFDIREVRDLGLILLRTDVSDLPEGVPLRHVTGFFARLTDGWVREDGSRSTAADEAKAAVYCARLGLASIPGVDRAARDFYDAGIPIEVAREVIAAGGSVQTARAIHEGNIAHSLASGYL